MQEKIEVLAYKEITDKCPECKGEGKIHCSTYPTCERRTFQKTACSQIMCYCVKECESCGGSGKVNKNDSEFTLNGESKEKFNISAVVRMFKMCDNHKNYPEGCCDNKPEHEYNCMEKQTFKVGEKYKFALQTINRECKDCKKDYSFFKKVCMNCRSGLESKNGFEPLIIEGIVRKEGIPFKIKDNELDSFINSMTKEQGFFILDLCGKLSDGEYLLLPKVEVIK